MVSLDAIFLIAKSTEQFVSKLAAQAAKFSELRTCHALLEKRYQQSDGGQPPLTEEDVAQIAQQAKHGKKWLRYDGLYHAVKAAAGQGRDLSFLEKMLPEPTFGLVDETW